jgi:hypothetical protein
MYCHPKYWSERERLQLLTGIEAGLSSATIALRMGGSRTVTAIDVYMKRHHRRRALRPYSARRLATALGIGCSKTVAKWVALGWLHASARGQLSAGRGRRTSVLYGDILAFLEDPHYWHVWRVERITERRLREFAQRVRGDVPEGIYLTPGQVAARYFVGRASVHDWIQRGLFPNARRWGNWWIPESDLARPADGYRFIPPCQRSRVGIAARRFTPLEDARLLALRSTGASWHEIGRALGRPFGSCAGRYERLTAPRAVAARSTKVA